MKVLAGEKKLETEHKESGSRFKLNVETCYFSQRLVTERLRIAKQVKKSEKILVVGSGVGPYPIVIAKNAKPREIVGVEVNPAAHKFAIENIKLNKLENVEAVKGDIRKIKLGKFDRVILVAPHEGANLVPAIKKNIKKGGRLHVLEFAPADNFKEASDRVKKEIKCRILRVVKAGQHAVRSYRVCVDAKI